MRYSDYQAHALSQRDFKHSNLCKERIHSMVIQMDQREHGRMNGGNYSNLEATSKFLCRCGEVQPARKIL